MFGFISCLRSSCLRLLAGRWKDPGGARKVAGVTIGTALQIILVLRLRLPEGANRLQLARYLSRPEAGCVDVRDRLQRGFTLRFVGIIDRRAIAPAAVVALAIARGRIVDLEEKFEDPAVADLIGIEIDLDRLGVRAVVAIGRVRHIAAAVTDTGADDAGEFADQVLHAPEAAAGKDGTFGHDQFSSIWFRNSE